jgi:coenzyme F420-0:L-glutamate ligase/coenzyme F420-1:gamma-L-glutamate ligase
MIAPPPLAAEPLPGIPEVEPGADLAALIADAAARAGVAIGAGDLVAIAQKAVSKAEGRVRRLADVSPGERATDLGARLDKDPRLVQLILDESRDVLRAERGVLIVRMHQGFVCANAGVDRSNLPDGDSACLLPADPDASARAIRAGLRDRLGAAAAPAVLISDSFGRAWRLGQADVAIGCAGLEPLEDLRGGRDSEGRELAATVEAVADSAAGAAALARRKAGREAVVIVRGLERFVSAEDGPGAAALLRPVEEDLFG